MKLRIVESCVALAVVAGGAGCKRSEAEDNVSTAAPLPPPPPAFPLAVDVAPAPAPLASASAPAGEDALSQAKSYQAKGQSAVARLVLEKKALGPSGTKEEKAFLAALCQEEGDDECVQKASGKSGDAGTAKKSASAKSPARGGH